MASGSIAAAAVSMVTISPELIVSTGLSAALKLPMCTVAGLGISVYSAQSTFGTVSGLVCKAGRFFWSGYSRLQAGLFCCRAAA
jgi:hypothetical protein